MLEFRRSADRRTMGSFNQPATPDVGAGPPIAVALREHSFGRRMLRYTNSVTDGYPFLQSNDGRHSHPPDARPTRRTSPRGARLREFGVTLRNLPRPRTHRHRRAIRPRSGARQACVKATPSSGLSSSRLPRRSQTPRDIGDRLAARRIKLSWAARSTTPTDPMGKMFFNILATFTEFEVDLLRMRTREGMAVAGLEASDRSCRQQTELRRMHGTRTPPQRTVRTSPDPPSTAPSQAWKLLLHKRSRL